MGKNLGIAIVLLLAATFRFYGLNWDSNFHLHPDERFLTMVTLALKWPASLAQYLDTQNSLLNPHNVGFPFFVYGTFPLFLTKFVAGSLNLADYNNLTLVGRFLSGLFDLGTTLLVCLITLQLVKSKSTALISSFLYATMVLPIQQSHFFTTDSFLVFFLAFSYYLLLLLNIKHSTLNIISLGLAFGLALASKITALLFLPILTLGLLKSRQMMSFIIFVFLTVLTLRLAQPYLFFGLKLNPAILANWRQLKSFGDPSSAFPPAIQWLHAPDFLFPLENILLWGLGLPLGLIALASLPYVLIKYRHNFFIVLALVWIFGLFAYQGSQFVKALRYFYPIYPFLAVTSGLFLVRLPKKLLVLAFGLALTWTISFVTIYSRPHSRIAATDWILQNIPPGSILSCEHWDDCLPLAGRQNYQQVEFPLYWPDTPHKWDQMQLKLDSVGYIILSSNRLYGSIVSAAEKYPQTAKFYADLFSGRLGFAKVAEFTSRPNFPLLGAGLCLTPTGIRYGRVAFPSQECPLPGISFVDDYADETWTVYDHPKVIIFGRQKI